MKMMLHMGAAVFHIPAFLNGLCLLQVPLDKTSMLLKTDTGKKVTPKRVCQMTVPLDRQSFNLPSDVIERNYSLLCGKRN